MKIGVVAPMGKMGNLILQAANHYENMEISAVLGPIGRDYIGKKLSEVCPFCHENNVVITSDLANFVEDCELVIDYSTKETSLELLQLCKDRHRAFVCGTTGFSSEEMSLFTDAAAQIPIIYAANTSRVVNLMYELLELAAKAIGNASDIEIIEMHDRLKKDAPSGTSKEMGERLIQALCSNQSLEEVSKYGRRGEGLRSDSEIGYHSIRSGDISSTHTVLFGLLGERLEITHHAHNWQCFAEGALACAAYLEHKKPGLYLVKDVLGL